MNGFQIAVFIPMAIAIVSMGRTASKATNVIGSIVIALGFVANAVYCGLYL